MVLNSVDRVRGERRGRRGEGRLGRGKGEEGGRSGIRNNIKREQRRGREGEEGGQREPQYTDMTKSYKQH